MVDKKTAKSLYQNYKEYEEKEKEKERELNELMESWQEKIKVEYDNELSRKVDDAWKAWDQAKREKGYAAISALEIIFEDE